MSFKKITSLLICLLLISQSVLAASFSDVSASHKNSEAIYKMADCGIVSGYDDGTFKPDNSVTRAEMCTFIARIFGYNKSTGLNIELPFADVSDSYWAIQYIRYAYSKGIVSGMGDGTFLPAERVTYEQAVKMLVCAAGLEAESKLYSGDKWYSGYLETASKSKMLGGVTVNVGAGASRADIVQLIYNAYSNGLFSSIGSTQSKPSGTGQPADKNPADDENTETDDILETIEITKEVKTIVVDPGHNYDGYDKGARTDDDSAIEEIITWRISERLVKYLEEYGFTVYLTREGEQSSIASSSVTESLKARVDFANELDADLFVSVHCNTGGGTGVEAYCYDLNGSSAPLAKKIAKKISEETKMYNRGAKQANFYVIKNTVMPAVLVETGFLDNKNDVEILNSTGGQDKIAKAIADAVYEGKEIKIKKVVSKAAAGD